MKPGLTGRLGTWIDEWYAVACGVALISEHGAGGCGGCSFQSQLRTSSIESLCVGITINRKENILRDADRQDRQ
jgi:hypothetical protein